MRGDQAGAARVRCAQVSLSRFFDWDEDGFAPMDRREGELKTMFDQLEGIGRAVATLRS